MDSAHRQEEKKEAKKRESLYSSQVKTGEADHQSSINLILEQEVQQQRVQPSFLMFPHLWKIAFLYLE